MSAAALALVPKRFSLVEYLDDVESILDTLDGLDDGPETTEHRDALSRMLIDKIAGTKTKIDSTCRVLANFASAEAAAKIERDRLDLRAKYFARQTERLETYLLAVLAASGLDKIDGNTAGVARRKNPPKVAIDREGDIPLEFWRSPPIPPIPADVPDKAAIAKALKSDPGSVSGCRLTQDFRLVLS